MWPNEIGRLTRGPVRLDLNEGKSQSVLEAGDERRMWRVDLRGAVGPDASDIADSEHGQPWLERRSRIWVRLGGS
jgi:hypothetical protein